MTNKFQAMETALDSLIGQTCWSVIVSSGLDNAVTFSLGAKLPRSLTLDAPNLTADQQQFTGSYELTIANCTWRLDSPDTIITSWSDDTTTKSEALGFLIGQAITNWEITWPGLDLTLHFDDILSLRLFCDQTDPTESGENYSLLTPRHLFNVGVRSQLTRQPRPNSSS